jgi:hypothetical protein
MFPVCYNDDGVCPDCGSNCCGCIFEALDGHEDEPDSWLHWTRNVAPHMPFIDTDVFREDDE